MSLTQWISRTWAALTFLRKTGVEWGPAPPLRILTHMGAVLMWASPLLPPVRKLRRLDISDLPAVSSPGLTQILVEEMLPNCEVLGAEWTEGLKLGPEKLSRDTASPIPA